jgi:hemolysin activation/secretion protein
LTDVRTIHRIKHTHLATAACLSLTSIASFAQRATEAPLPGTQVQRLQQQRIDADTTTGTLGDALRPDEPIPAAPDLAQLPVETPCFAIREVVLENNPFDWLARTLQPVVGQCIGPLGLKVVQDAAANALIERGYLTTRVQIPQQSLSDGSLTLQVIAGHIGEIRTDGDAIGALPMALPTHNEALLNQRDVDQSLENLRRLPSQADARFDIVPGERPGDSDLVLHPGTGRRWHAAFGVDNAGLDATGKYQLSASFTFDSPLHLYDQLQLSGVTNANVGAKDQGAAGAALAYSVPLGYAMLGFDASRSRYLQTYAGYSGPIEYSGIQTNAGVKLSGVVQRSAHARTELRARLFRAINHNSYDGTPLEIQARDVYGYELGVAHRHYFGNVQTDASVGWRASLPGVSRNSGYVVGASGFDGRTQVETASASVLAPFRIGQQPFSYQFNWSMQNARTPLWAPDYFMIGTRYAVRGFDQQSTLAAESGWAVSNELDWYVPTPVGIQALYTGIDAGRVRGPSAQYLAGNTLVGMVAGIRGNLAPKHALGTSVSYDVSLGWPLYKPQGFPNRSPTVLVQVSALI